jgi:hypothetical protein
MKKYLFATLCIAALAICSADAKTHKLPDADDAVASVDIPDAWEIEEIEGGIGASSPDGAVYFAIVAVGDKKAMDAEIEDTFRMLKEHNVELDDSTKKEGKFKVNGMDAEELTFEGKDEDGPTSISIAFVPMKDKAVVMTYWVTTAKEKANEIAVGKIVNSLKPVS